MESRSLSALAGVGSFVVALGCYLPWLSVNPRLPPEGPIPTILLPGMESGISGVDYVLLALAGLVLLAHLNQTREPRRSGLTLVTGVFTVLACAGYLFISPSVGFISTFVPAIGWYVTLVGASILSVVGGVGVLGAAALGPR